MGQNYRTPAQESGLDKLADSTYDSRGQGYSSGPGGGSGSGGRGGEPTAQNPATGDHLKPKGKNLHEVDSFEGEENASFKYGNDVGGENDPGRQATGVFQARPAAGNAAYPTAKKEGAQLDQGGFENLDNDRNA